MSIERAKAHLKKYQMDEKMMEFDVSSATVELAAQAIGCEPARIAKSISLKVDDRIILVVAAGDMKIDNQKYKAYFQKKAVMLKFEEVEALVGHGVGGVCPFGVNEGVEVYLDDSLKRFDTVYPACGTSNSAIELTIEQLETVSEYKEWISVCKEK